jgi:hypothetical protein
MLNTLTCGRLLLPPVAGSIRPIAVHIRRGCETGRTSLTACYRDPGPRRVSYGAMCDRWGDCPRLTDTRFKGYGTNLRLSNVKHSLGGRAGRVVMAPLRSPVTLGCTCCPARRPLAWVTITWTSRVAGCCTRDHALANLHRPWLPTPPAHGVCGSRDESGYARLDIWACRPCLTSWCGSGGRPCRCRNAVRSAAPASHGP